MSSLSNIKALPKNATGINLRKNTNTYSLNMNRDLIVRKRTIIPERPGTDSLKKDNFNKNSKCRKDKQ